jgi:hypothetical protein
MAAAYKIASSSGSKITLSRAALKCKGGEPLSMNPRFVVPPLGGGTAKIFERVSAVPRAAA